MQPPHHANQQILNIELLENVHNPRKPPKKIPGMYRRSAVYLPCLHNIPVKCKESLFILCLLLLRKINKVCSHLSKSTNSRHLFD